MILLYLRLLLEGVYWNVVVKALLIYKGHRALRAPHPRKRWSLAVVDTPDLLNSAISHYRDLRRFWQTKKQKEMIIVSSYTVVQYAVRHVTISVTHTTCLAKNDLMTKLNRRYSSVTGKSNTNTLTIGTWCWLLAYFAFFITRLLIMSV